MRVNIGDKNLSICRGMPQNKLVNTTVVDHMITQSGIDINVIGTFDQPITLPSPFLVQNIHNVKDSHIESASPKSQPTPGQLGDIQAAEPMSTNFIFNPFMVQCNNYETTINCHIMSVVLYRPGRAGALPIISKL